MYVHSKGCFYFQVMNGMETWKIIEEFWFAF